MVMVMVLVLVLVLLPVLLPVVDYVSAAGRKGSLGR